MRIRYQIFCTITPSFPNVTNVSDSVRFEMQVTLHETLDFELGPNACLASSLSFCLPHPHCMHQTAAYIAMDMLMKASAYHPPGTLPSVVVCNLYSIPRVDESEYQ
jgi:hypothetical protein